MMTPKERLLAPFKGIKPDRPAWLADLSYWQTAARKMKKPVFEGEGPESVKRLHEKLGVCCYYDFWSSACERKLDDVVAETRVECDRQYRRWKTPKGELREEWEYIPQGYCWARTKYAVRDVHDLETLNDLFQRTHYAPSPDDFRKKATFLGDSGLPIMPVARSPLPALMTDWAGVEATIFLLMDHREAVEKTLKIIDRSNDASFLAALENDAELFHFCDNLDSGNSASYYDAYMKDYYEKRLAQLHSRGKFAVVHLDGSVRGLLPKLAASGFDGIESLTPRPVGDVAIEECAELVGNAKTVLWGGLPGAMFSPPWKADQIVEMTHKVLTEWDRGGRLVVGSADQVPPDGDIDFCARVAETIAAWR